MWNIVPLLVNQNLVDTPIIGGGVMRNISEGFAIFNRRVALAGGVAATAFAASAPSLVFGQAAEAVVRTKQGQLRGRRIGSIYEFRGVRYAEPQTAENR